MKPNTSGIPTQAIQPEPHFQLFASPGEELGRLHCKDADDPIRSRDAKHASTGASGSSSNFVRALLVLEGLHVLDDNKACLKLVEHLAERVGYRCAGYTASSRVAELMLLSASASSLADQLDKEDLL